MKELEEKLSIIVKAADDKRAFDMKVLNISELTSIADYFVIVSGNSDRQAIAIAEEIEDKMQKKGYKMYNKEGYRTGRWILLDYGDIIVHVFHKEDRDFYNLERLWIDGKEVDADQMM